MIWMEKMSIEFTRLYNSAKRGAEIKFNLLNNHLKK